MTSAGEVFVVQLARASRKANRFVRHLQPADRADVLAAALLWCWQNRENYSLTTTLETWFVNAVRDAHKAWSKGELREAADYVAEIPTGDTTQAHVEAQDTAAKLASALPKAYRKIALMQVQGFTRAEMEERGFTRREIDEARVRIKQLKKLMPDSHEFRKILRTPMLASSDDEQAAQPRIDRDIEQLEAMPKHGKDCIPCWLCKWYEGYMPAERKSVRMEIKEPEVHDAIAATEAEKVRIAQEVRDGLL
jgi:hypothetical protein